ncbi:MAG: hypothetical protein RLZZ178_1255, partial [Verrucomicrobiota bacterium]
MEALRPSAYGLVMRRLALLCLILACPGLLSAHPEWKEANCLGVIDANNQLTLTIKFDVPSFLIGQTSKDAQVKALDELMQTPGRLAASIEPGQSRLLDGLRLNVDGRDTPVLLVSFPTAETIAATSARQGEADRYPVMLNARLSAQLPAKA